MNGVHDDNTPSGINGHAERKLGVYDDVHFDPKLTPKKYQMKGKYCFAVYEGKRACSPLFRN